MVSVASQLIEKVTAHVQSDSLEDVRGICADGTYFPNNLHTSDLHLPVGVAVHLWLEVSSLPYIVFEVLLGTSKQFQNCI